MQTTFKSQGREIRRRALDYIDDIDYTGPISSRYPTAESTRSKMRNGSNVCSFWRSVHIMKMFVNTRIIQYEVKCHITLLVREPNPFPFCLNTRSCRDREVARNPCEARDLSAYDRLRVSIVRESIRPSRRTRFDRPIHRDATRSEYLV